MHFGLAGAVAAIMVESVLSSGAFVMAATRVSGVGLEWMRLLRIGLAAAASAGIASFVLYLDLTPLLALLLGGIGLATLYAIFSLVFQCWSRADIQQLQGLHQRFASGRPLLLGRLLTWSGARARRML